MSAAEHLHPVTDPVDLDDFLCGDEPDWDDPPPVTGDLDQVNQWLRRLARLDDRENDLVEQVNNEIARIQLWLSTQLIPIEREREWLTGAVGQYHRARLDRDRRAKTIALPAGTLRARAQQPVWNFVDEDEFLDWASVNAPALIRRPEPVTPPAVPDKTAAKKVLQIPGDPRPGDIVHPVDADGTVITSIEITVREPRFVIDLDGSES